MALLRLWREKRGELEPKDLSGNLIVQLGVVTEDLNRRWYEANTGEVVTDVQRWVKHPILSWMAATLDGVVERHRGGVRGEVHAALVVLGGRLPLRSTWRSSSTTCGLSDRGVGFVDHHRRRQVGRDLDPRGSALSAPSAHRREAVLAMRPERRDASSVRGRAASAADRGGPDGRHERVKLLGGVRGGVLPNAVRRPSSTNKAKTELKALMPEDAKEASGHGVRAKRSKVRCDQLRGPGGWRAAMHRSSENFLRPSVYHYRPLPVRNIPN